MLLLVHTGKAVYGFLTPVSGNRVGNRSAGRVVGGAWGIRLAAVRAGGGGCVLVGGIRHHLRITTQDYEFDKVAQWVALVSRARLGD